MCAHHGDLVSPPPPNKTEEKENVYLFFSAWCFWAKFRSFVWFLWCQAGNLAETWQPTLMSFSLQCAPHLNPLTHTWVKQGGVIYSIIGFFLSSECKDNCKHSGHGNGTLVAWTRKPRSMWWVEKKIFKRTGKVSGLKGKNGSQSWAQVETTRTNHNKTTIYKSQWNPGHHNSVPFFFFFLCQSCKKRVQFFKITALSREKFSTCKHFQ